MQNLGSTEYLMPTIESLGTKKREDFLYTFKVIYEACGYPKDDTYITKIPTLNDNKIETSRNFRQMESLEDTIDQLGQKRMKSFISTFNKIYSAINYAEKDAYSENESENLITPIDKLYKTFNASRHQSRKSLHYVCDVEVQTYSGNVEKKTKDFSNKNLKSRSDSSEQFVKHSHSHKKLLKDTFGSLGKTKMDGVVFALEAIYETLSYYSNTQYNESTKGDPRKKMLLTDSADASLQKLLRHNHPDSSQTCGLSPKDLKFIKNAYRRDIIHRKELNIIKDIVAVLEVIDLTISSRDTKDSKNHHQKKYELIAVPKNLIGVTNLGIFATFRPMNWSRFFFMIVVVFALSALAFFSYLVFESNPDWRARALYRQTKNLRPVA